jgi:Amt family ammonium transporter
MTGALVLLVPSPAFASDGAPLVDRLWVLVAAAMVFLMQAGFLCLEVGAVRPHSMPITALKNLVDWVVCVAAFFFVGWALMFGPSDSGWFGSGLMLPEGAVAGGHPIGIAVHFVFQLAFAATAATIVSGALAERTSFLAYMVVSAVVTAFIYPVVGHWAWGDSFLPENQTFLTRLGFRDFAGSTVVHSVGGWVALMGIWQVGPRLGRFGPDGTARTLSQAGAHWSALGALILWFSWWAFNGGSTLALDGRVAPIIVVTCLSGAFGGLGALADCFLRQGGRDINAKFINGTLAGLVGITAGCAYVPYVAAPVIGVVSGLIANVVADLLLRARLDDPVGAVPVHLGPGIWGTVAVALFGRQEFLPNGRLIQILVQIAGVVACAAWVCLTAAITFWALRRWAGLRVSPMQEQHGFDAAGSTPTAPDPELTEDDLRRLLGGAG